MLSILSSRIDILKRPRVRPMQAPDRLGKIHFELASPMEVIGSVVFDGQPGESTAGWEVGWLQAQWVETNWAVYRGETQAEGSVFVQRARPPARPQQACFDTVDPTLRWVVPVGLSRPLSSGGAPYPFSTKLPEKPRFPLTVDVQDSDVPQDAYNLVRKNHLTKAFNILSEAQIELAFCTLLAARSPDGRMHQLRGFYWNVSWQYLFHQIGKTGMIKSTAVLKGSRCRVGHVFEGAPNDPRFASVLTDKKPVTCNALAHRSSATPNIQETAGWPNFDVRR